MGQGAVFLDSRPVVWRLSCFHRKWPGEGRHWSLPGGTVSRRECPCAGAALLHESMQAPGPSCCAECVTPHSCGLWLRVAHPSAQACLWEGEIRVRAASTVRVQPGNCLSHLHSYSIILHGVWGPQQLPWTQEMGVTIYKTVRWEVSLNGEEGKKS